jgi:putative PIN family toxin of toxin-antitoxin system
MQKIVIDTNVVVSSFISSKGISAQIIALIALDEEFIICYNADILAEYQGVLTRTKFDKYNFKPADIENFIKKVKETGILTEPPKSNISLSDESDRIFYDTAKAAEAILITGNIKHYPSESFIMRPADYWHKILTESENI